MTVGQSIKKARTDKGYSQQRLANKIGTFPCNVHLWEHDKVQPCLYLLMKMADVLEISLDDLVGRTVPSNEV